MPKVPAFAKAFAGRWRIVEMNVWDNDPSTSLKRRICCAEFSWEGYDENDPASAAGGCLRHRRPARRPLLHSRLTSSKAC
jgi:hypothetical protein